MGTPLERLCESHGLRASSVYGRALKPCLGMPNNWRVTLRYRRRVLTVDFHGGAAVLDDPSPADVISSLCSDACAGEMSFEDFCGDFGYDTDSIRARDTWEACRAIGPRVRRFLGSDFDLFARAEH